MEKTMPEHPRASTEGRTSLYDVVSGRIRRRGGLDPSLTMERAPSTAIAPDEQLLMMAGIDHVPFVEHPDLPSADIVHAVNWYASQFVRRYREPSVWRMYDETALLAIAVLVEETIKQGLGPNGHLMWAEDSGEPIQQHSRQPYADERSGQPRKRFKLEADSGSDHESLGGSDEDSENLRD